MRTVLLLSGSALALVLGAGPAEALSDETEAGLAPEQVCQANKLEATTRYHRCVTYAYRKAIVRGGEPSDEQIARCDHRLDRAFERAEQADGCGALGGPEPLGKAIRDQVEQTLGTVTTTTGCAQLSIRPGQSATCTVSTTGKVIDLQDVVAALQVEGVTEDTILYIQAWGASGGHGGDIYYGRGGYGGYTQTITSVTDLINERGSSEIWYYLGQYGREVHDGAGGSATVVAYADLSETPPSKANLALVAGGGGGGGSGRGDGIPSEFIYGNDGGDGGTLFPAEGTGSEYRAGSSGGDAYSVATSGGGGSAAGAASGGKAGGGSANPGDAGFAFFGGDADRSPAPVQFMNTTDLDPDIGVGGWGGGPGDHAPGGGGGGGYGSGGGGREGDSDSSWTSGGGGGGGTLVQQSRHKCAGAPTTKPANEGPNVSQGFVQIVFDLGICRLIRSMTL